MSQSKDVFEALQFFYDKKFPNLVTNELFISGESYGGIYVPYLSW
jgi:carboxypeptidase C (cathepsin A)|tara:strand:+ start:259 stop:393 length:135 start_codon:yes stop_codon:yes gene_type:complete